MSLFFVTNTAYFQRKKYCIYVFFCLTSVFIFAKKTSIFIFAKKLQFSLIQHCSTLYTTGVAASITVLNQLHIFSLFMYFLFLFGKLHICVLMPMFVSSVQESDIFNHLIQELQTRYKDLYRELYDYTYKNKSSR